ncbi:MAG: hypothetical protein PHO62_05930 [Sulfurimonas sp.]|uniref:hypothetical protein n=1 Tax=Sulfurimonas sp. TaxID=2022749 RepID=UPI0026184A4D|nr:hypothetical protein [Sulfurimonas sp.]MDD5372946.1 hypothetical protein [Sulfurimonas sp.]MDD5401179.1 hypothetical protein [Sulfurimonas sp.]
MAILKRYALAIFFLLLVSFLMLLGTMGVKSFGEKMIEDTGIEMKPRGENLTK